MKRNSIAALLAAALILGAKTAIAAPVDLSIGGTAWYIWWKPAWADAKATTTAVAQGPALFREDSHDFQPSSNVMAGPILSIGFLERWSIQSVVTMGRLSFKSRGYSTDALLSEGSSGVAPSYKKYTRDILKWDSDTSIGCAVHRMVKIFAGFKHQGYRFEEKMENLLFVPGPPPVFTRALTDNVRAYGGGIGLGLTFPLATEFYMMASISGVALWSFETISVKRMNSFIYSSINGLIPLYIIPQKGQYLSYGGTASLSFAYNIEKINTTLSLGGRYQLLFNRQGYNRYNPLYNDVSINIIDRQFDHFFGITFSAIYTFHIGKRA